MQQSVKNIMEDLNEVDQKKFIDSLQMIMFSDINGLDDLIAIGNNQSAFEGAFLARIDGKTARQIIIMGEKINKESNPDPLEKNKQSDIQNIKEDAKTEVTKKLVNESLNTTLITLKAERGNYNKNLKIVVNFENLTDKNIKGIKGTAVFKDMFGDLIKKITISSDDSVLAHETFQYTGYMDINEFIDSDIKLATTSKEKIDFSFVPEIILFEDGSKIETP